MSAVDRRAAAARAGSRLQELVWNRRASTWDHHGVAGLGKVIAAVLDQARADGDKVAVDLGCGTGALAIPLAERGVTVTAVDLSRAMVERLEAKAAEAGLTNVTGTVAAVEHLDLAPSSIDLVVSNYALHHLRDADKQAVVRAAAGWLRPGGRLVIGDMMFGRGATARDRAIIGNKVMVLVRRGPGGWWRLAKNVGRFSFRLQERPVSIDTWKGYLEAAGFTDVTAVPVVAEAAVVAGTKP
ncbi:MAG: class I SAM-dependent methyltransferase [Acidimicrobiales bacterium]